MSDSRATFAKWLETRGPAPRVYPERLAKGAPRRCRRCTRTLPAGSKRQTCPRPCELTPELALLGLLDARPELSLLELLEREAGLEVVSAPAADVGLESVARLNPIQTAEIFDHLIRHDGYTQASLGELVGKDRATVANTLRLLKLPPRLRAMVVTGELAEGHARALLGAPNARAMVEIAYKTARAKLPVRQVEQLVRDARDEAA